MYQWDYDYTSDFISTFKGSTQHKTSSKNNKNGNKGKQNVLVIIAMIAVALLLCCCAFSFIVWDRYSDFFPVEEILPTVAPTQAQTPFIEDTRIPLPTATEIAPATLPPTPTNTPIPTATTIVEPTLTSAPVGVFRSCQEILENGQSIGDDYYMIDADGTEGRLEPFEVFCDMTRQGGGWTLYAYHTDGIKVIEVPTVTKTETGVLQGDRWRAIRDNMTTGMMFVDEVGRVTTISIEKLNRATCQQVRNPESLVPPSGQINHIWHDEDNGCGGTGRDYSIIVLQGPSYANYRTNGASLYQWSAEKFDIWPYDATASYSEQNELFYYLK